jgi:ribosomal 30S subunit maturation factor RimM
MENGDLLATATIGAPFGINGELKVYPNNERHDYLKAIEGGHGAVSGGSVRQVEIIAFRWWEDSFCCQFPRV